MQPLLKKISKSALLPPITIMILIILLYYPLFLKGQIPFPADLMVGSYLPWLDYYKMPIKNPLISDVFSQLYLWKMLAVNSYKLGQFPLWNPYSFAGTPLLANFQSSVLYPLNAILFLSKDLGWGYYIFSQTILSSLSMYLFLKLFLTQKSARILGSLIFALGGLMTTWTELGTAVHAMVWLPLTLYLLSKYLTTQKTLPLCLLPIGITLSIFAGTVQVTLYIYLSLVLYSIIFCWPLKKRIKTLSTIWLFILISLPLAAIQLLPSFNLLQNSIRSSDMFITENNFGLLPVSELLKFFNADFFGHTSTRNYYGFLNYFETSFYLGALSLPFLIQLFRKWKTTKITIFLLSLLIISFCLSFSNPISQLLYYLRLPLLTQSYASRALFLLNFSAAALIAFSFNQVIEEYDLKTFFKSTIYALIVLIAILIGTFISYKFFIINLNSITIDPQTKTKFLTWDPASAALINKVALRNTIIPLSITLLASLSVLVILALQKIRPLHKSLSMQLFCFFIIGLYFFDLSRYFLKFNNFAAKNLIYPKTPITEFLEAKTKEGPFYLLREYGEVMPPNTWTAYGIQALEGYDPIHAKDINEFISFINNNNFNQNNASRFAEIGANYDAPLLKASNAKYIIGILRNKIGEVGGDEINQQMKKFPIAFKDKSTIIYENPNALPRYYFAKKTIALSADTRQSLISRTIDPLSTTITNQPLLNNNFSAQASAEMQKSSPNESILTTHSSNPQFLIVSESFDPDWEATIDQKEVPIIKTNLYFRGLDVPAGNHLIRFSYRPKSFIWGETISIITLFTLALFYLIGKKKRLVVN